MASWYRFEHLLTATGWRSPAWMKITAAGAIAEISDQAPADEPAVLVSGYALPGLPNLHSHAMQRAMAGLAETAGRPEESFWTWRNVMYTFVEKLDPEQVEAIAAQLYVEMLKAGYTSVAEFHYLHHAPSGQPYADPAEMSHHVLAAAAEAGIGMTLLPVLYAYGGFGNEPLGRAQQRFGNDVDGFFRIVEAGSAATATMNAARIGVAPHSLRAVSPAMLAELLAGVDRLDPTAPIHIHVAEQVKEVCECLAATGKRPVEWLLEHTAMDRRWCLVHATHLTEWELEAVVDAQATVGLCPTTEANLGDGIFPFNDFIGHDGAYGIGSDSNISIDPAEELRWLHYMQRLNSGARSLGKRVEDSLGTMLYRQACHGGASALGQAVGTLDPGRRADIVVLDADHPTLCKRPAERILDAYVFCNTRTSPVRDVMVAGDWVVRDHQHRAEEAVRERYQQVMADLLR